jgi:uncharacterized protein (TIGR02757 family)
MSTSRASRLRYALDALYDTYNRRGFVHPDPLELLYLYDDPGDREIVALLASGLAYGRVAQILRSVRGLLDRMGPSPLAFLWRTSPADFAEVFAGFKHRWTTGREVADLLAGARRVIDRHGSLGRCLGGHLRTDDKTILPALAGFAEEMRVGQRNSLLPCITAGGACKRLHLMLRWLVRRDEVDPGGWEGISPGLLMVPVDTHMHQVGVGLGMCKPGQAGGRAALAMTEAFRTIQPSDPVRYDFALTRLGIRKGLDLGAFLARCGNQIPQ